MHYGYQALRVGRSAQSTEEPVVGVELALVRLLNAQVDVGRLAGVYAEGRARAEQVRERCVYAWQFVLRRVFLAIEEL